MEFAFAIGVPEVVKITESYNKVRFGGKGLSKDESDEIEGWLNEMERQQRKGR